MWKLPLLEVKATVSGSGNTDLVGIFQDSGNQAIPPKGSYRPVVEKLKKSDAFHAKSGSNQLIRLVSAGSAENLLLVGLGSAQDITLEKLRVAGGAAWARLSAEKLKEVCIQVESFLEGKSGAGSKAEVLEPLAMIRAFLDGLMLSAYQISKHQQEKAGTAVALNPSRVTLVVKDQAMRARLEKEALDASQMAECVRLTRDWSNEPSNYGTPTYYANEAKRLAQKNGLKCKILTEKEAAREKMGLFLGVGQGSEREGRVVVVEYTPKSSKNAKTIALVGKGVTFDSGGISIKPSLKMEEMKHDMTGAATVMGAVLLAAQRKISNRVIGIMAFTDNMPDGNAIQPGNVLTSRSGKTVEVINTDAEGRLILADALDYAQDYQPDAVVNIATLTGAVSIALGKQCCAVLGNDDTLINSLMRAGETHGEKMWQLPLYDEYFEDLKSDYADMKNSANDSNGGTIRGAIFLKQFIRKGVHWAHLDIAAMANNLTTISYMPKKGASGLYVRALAQFAADF